MNYVNPAKLVDAAGEVDDAVAHFKARCAELHDVRSELRGKAKLSGGYGETGGYQAALWDFTIAFDRELLKFLADEDLFCKFLEGFSDRIDKAAGIYRKNELMNTEEFSSITHGLEPEGE